MDIERLLEISPELSEYVIEVRRHLHENPELSWQEYETTRYIRGELERIPGVELIPLGMDTGVVARILGGKPGRRVALRADMDALRGHEAYISPCMSGRAGVAHLCGHDFHMAALLGAARLLSAHRDGLCGEVVLIFQPAEETTQGAAAMVSHGLYERCPFDAVFGLHNRPEIGTGHVVVKPGALMASKINFRIRVHGVGGHGSMPHRCVDPIVCAAAMVGAVLTIASRNVDPMRALVLSICSIHAGTPDNLIVDMAEMTGSMRYLDRATGDRALERLREVVSGVSATYGCRSEFEIVERVRSVENAGVLYGTALQAARDALGADAVVESESALATEDFSEYMQFAPGWFYWIGNSRAGDMAYPWHHEKFHVDEPAVLLGARLLAASAWRFLDADVPAFPAPKI